jgi:hypothetical protein
MPALADKYRDGDSWHEWTRAERNMWAIGWFDGLASAEGPLLGQIMGMTSAELVQGLNQFYDNDYRNLKIPLQLAAPFVARFSRAKMTKTEAATELEELRDDDYGDH